MINIGINGFGRIGRLILRAILENYRNKINVVAINDLGSIETNAHLIKYDSTHGIMKDEITTLKDGFKVGEQNIKVFAERDPINIPWGKIGADVVLECTGIFLDKSSAEKHIKAGAKKVIISAPGKEVDFTIVQGVNSKELKKNHNIISNGSCTTNCLAPVAMVLEKSFGISYGYMTTIHSYTGDQKLLDTLHKDLRRARSTEGAMIPTSTGAAKAMSLVLPSLKGKLDGTAIRVPTPNVSLIDFTLVTEKNVTPEEINQAMTEAANGELKGILDVNQKPLVSKDFNHNPHSSIFDVTQTQVIKGKFIRVLSWYDNEWGFSNRMCDTAIQIADLV
ncbi:type I glyceraldehyde-3-phosphate dehydrogenase [Candidatus Pelagibacter communis]|uniref:type I glyceraldehyde-3-phosphate dehydrogenase n=1 Tax=Pelagibacter ubique TaxID=198252 RepID=UPI00094C34C5|nr:type I glyceraldehyde-3-phosphate dehydrogenase [Candidatus Pelagibacter ubique]